MTGSFKLGSTPCVLSHQPLCCCADHILPSHTVLLIEFDCLHALQNLTLSVNSHILFPRRILFKEKLNVAYSSLVYSVPVLLGTT